MQVNVKSLVEFVNENLDANAAIQQFVKEVVKKKLIAKPTDAKLIYDESDASKVAEMQISTESITVEQAIELENLAKTFPAFKKNVDNLKIDGDKKTLNIYFVTEMINEAKVPFGFEMTKFRTFNTVEQKDYIESYLSDSNLEVYVEIGKNKSFLLDGPDAKQTKKAFDLLDKIGLPNVYVNESKDSMFSDDEIEKIAKSAHETNVTFSKAFDGDAQTMSWTEFPDKAKDSIKNGVLYVIQNPEATSEELHNNWMEQKAADGWVYGATKDFEKKTHPNMVSYDKLDATSKAKDLVFKNAVLSLSSVINAGGAVNEGKDGFKTIEVSVIDARQSYDIVRDSMPKNKFEQIASNVFLFKDEDAYDVGLEVLKKAKIEIVNEGKAYSVYENKVIAPGTIVNYVSGKGTLESGTIVKFKRNDWYYIKTQSGNEIPFKLDMNATNDRKVRIAKDSFIITHPEEVKYVNEDKLPGGKSDGLTIEQIAEKHGVDVKQIEDELAMGLKIESEHTADLELQREIAMDHLTEMHNYYTKLADMEAVNEGLSSSELAANWFTLVTYIKSTFPNIYESSAPIKKLTSQVVDELISLVTKLK